MTGSSPTGRGSPLDPSVTRRDLVNGALAGAGAALLQAASPARAEDGSAEWDGYGGVGDYRGSNGETRRVTDAAHRIRDRVDGAELKGVTDTGETYDLVILGGGFNGVAALYEFRKRRPGGRALLLDNQEMFGGYAKSNDFDVDGVRVSAAQASMNFIAPETAQERADAYWGELGLPERLRFAEREDGDTSIKFQRSASGTLYEGEQCASMGYFFREAHAGDGGRWVRDVWRDDLARAPVAPAYRDGLLKLRAHRRAGKPAAGEAARLDGLTFADFATRELGVGPEVLSYITQGMCITGPQVSAFGAQSLPGLERYVKGSAGARLGERFVSFPAGNTVLVRALVRAVFPDAIRGPRTLAATASAPLDLAALDRPGAPCRLRLRATVMRVAHEGPPERADIVEVVYEKAGRLFRVRARAAVLGVGAWVSKHIVADLPPARRAALDRFLYSPILIANVALRNWRFLDRLGISAARWFDGFGFYASVRQPMLIDGRSAPFHPDKPIVMTFYVPFPSPGLPLEAQGPAARAQLYATSYARYEAQLLEQMQRLFAPGGFDARRDVAGVVLNRWGHAFVTSPPGFFFGQGGGPAPLEVATEPFGRIAFGQSGLESWLGASHAGKRAVEQISVAL